MFANKYSLKIVFIAIIIKPNAIAIAVKQKNRKNKTTKEPKIIVGAINSIPLR